MAESRDGINQKSVLSQFEKEAIFELKECVAKIVDDLSAEIEKGDFSAIAIDDPSGRIPGQILSEVLWRLYREKNILPPEIHYIQGDSPSRQRDKFDVDKKLDEMKTYFSNVRQRLEGTKQGSRKILYITEFLETATSAILFLRAVEKKWPAHVVSIGVDSEKVRIVPELIHRAGGLNTPFNYAMIGAPNICAARALSGVTKVNHGDLHSESLIFLAGKDEIKRKRLQGKVLEAYEMASNIAGEIVTEYKRKYRS